MKKIYFFFLSILLLVTLIACGAAVGEATSTPERTEPEAEDGDDIFPRPTITPVPEGEGAETPAATETPEGYPPPSNPVVQPETAYPGEDDTVWVVLPVGIQCEGDGLYSNLDEAVAALDEAGVLVTDQMMTDLPVAQACGQPTSEHFRAEIVAEGLAQAENLGWQRESE